MDAPGLTPTALHIGLTGGIGSGKSTVAGFLARRGAAIIDADAISRSLTAPDGRAMPAIAQTFGSEMLSLDGAMDRQAMRERIFRDPQAKRQLEHIIHPLVSQVTAEQAQAALQSGHRVLVFDVPLLVESPRWRKLVDKVLVVDCLESTQVARVMARSGMTSDAVQSIIRAQATRAQRLAAADITLFNEGLDLEQLRLAVNALTLNV